jgi:hypothetical protein
VKHLQVIRGRVRVTINVLENVTKCYLDSADMVLTSSPKGSVNEDIFPLHHWPAACRHAEARVGRYSAPTAGRDRATAPKGGLRHRWGD